jgi:hypothetical protein
LALKLRRESGGKFEKNGGKFANLIINSLLTCSCENGGKFEKWRENQSNENNVS